MTRRSASFRLIQSLCAILVLTCHFQLSLSSSSSTTASSSSSSIISAKSHHNEKIFKPNKRTIVSGFGAHSTKHSIFAPSASTTSSSSSSSGTESKSTKKTSKKQQQHSKASKSMSSKSSTTITDFDFGSKSLLVYKNKDDDDSSSTTTDSIIWLMDPKKSTSQKVCIWVDENGDWMSKLVEDNDGDDDDDQEKASSPLPPPLPSSSSELNGWTPVEGIYGFYKVPTGILLVLIVQTHNVFEAPPLNTNNNKSWWSIDKVQHLEVVHLFNSKAQQELSPIQIKEEVRQLRLLRKAWKQHEFYCCQYDDAVVEEKKDENENAEEATGDSSSATNVPIVRDMTKSLQSSFLAHHHHQATSQQQQQHRRSRNTVTSESSSQSSSSSSWWTANPDPRFFWNQVAVEPILAKCTATLEEGLDLEKDPSLMDPCTRFLLDHTIPVTSAFVGIQSDISCENDNDEKEESSTDAFQYTQLLISRRSRFRAGTRFTRRGADANGAVANYVETEQVLLLSKSQDKDDSAAAPIDKIASHVQTRGSIPIRWSSPADVKTYHPKVHIGTDPLAQARALRWHLLEQQAHYVLMDDKKGEQQGNNNNNNNNNSKKNKKQNTVQKDDDAFEMVFVNLVDKKSDQGRLGKAFDEVLQAVLEVHNNNSTTNTMAAPLVKHVWYDFHAEVKNGKWDRLAMLLKDVEPSLMAHNYLVVSTTTTTTAGSTKNDNSNGKKGKATTTPTAVVDYQIESKQTSMVRTNCMDCLDRTNVVQSILGRYILFAQLMTTHGGGKNNANNALAKKLFQKSKQLSLPWPQSEQSHRALWADNADAISRLYAGTPALKRDFTRTGQRTKLGALDDGMNSLQRYYLNNFMDADRQEGMDLMVGHVPFSNVKGGSTTTTTTTTTSSPTENEKDKDEGSIFSTRRSFLGGLFQPQQQQSSRKEENNGEDAKDDDDDDEEEENDNDDEVRQDAKDALDLRWVPGDLQEHLRSRAGGGDTEERKVMQEEEETKRGGLLFQKLKFGFSSIRALKAMDERSTSDLPWWSLEEEIDHDDNGAAIVEGGDDDDNVLQTLAPHQRHPTLTRANVLGVLLLGFKAPMVVAMGMVLFFGLLYLQEILLQDGKMIGRLVMKLDRTTEEDLKELEEEEEELRNLFEGRASLDKSSDDEEEEEEEEE